MPYITVNGARLYYEDTGEGNPIVFLHGYIGDTDDWENQVRLLSPKYRCLTIDQRGRGKAEALKRREYYSMDLFVDDIYQWLRQIKVDRFVLNGHSLGGMIAQGFTLSHPEMVAGLVLASTSSGPIPVSPDEGEYRKRLSEIAMAQGTVAAFDYDYERNPATRRRYTVHPETLQRMREKTRTTSPEGYVYVRAAIDNRPSFTERLGEIECPALAIVGSDDVGLVAPMKLIASKIPDCDFVLVPDSGHGVMYEKATEYNDALVEFLDRTGY